MMTTDSQKRNRSVKRFPFCLDVCKNSLISLISIWQIIVTRFRVRVEYGQDGSLESRLYLTGAGKDDTGRLVFFLALL